MVMRGDSGRAALEAMLLDLEDAIDCSEMEDATVEVEASESYEVLRDKTGCEFGVLIVIFSMLGSEVGSFSWKLKRELVPVDIGLIMAGDMFFKKSKYADGGVIGVLRASSLRRKPGEYCIGLRSSEGNVPDPGVCSEEDEDVVQVLCLLSKPLAAIVAETTAEAIAACRLFIVEPVVLKE